MNDTTEKDHALCTASHSFLLEKNTKWLFEARQGGCNKHSSSTPAAHQLLRLVVLSGTCLLPLEIMSHLILMEYTNVSVFWKKLKSIPTNALAWLLQVLRGASYTTPEETNTSRKDIKTTSPPSPSYHDL